MSDFRLLLLEISNEITNADLAKLKFLCEDVIPSRTAEGISQPFELFRALEQRNLLSEQNREFLASKLSDVNCIPLRNKLLGIQDDTPVNAMLGQEQIQPVRQVIPRNFQNTPVPPALSHDLAEDVSTSWKMLSRRLFIPEGVIKSIDNENHRVVEKCIAMFNEWKSRCGNKATVGVLREALEKIGRRDLSEKVRDEMNALRQRDLAERELAPGNNEREGVPGEERRPFPGVGGMRLALPNIIPPPSLPIIRSGLGGAQEQGEPSTTPVSASSLTLEPIFGGIFSSAEREPLSHEASPGGDSPEADTTDRGPGVSEPLQTGIQVTSLPSQLGLDRDGSFLDPEKYDPIKRLGSGGFAEVYLVIDRRTGQKTACKMFDLRKNHKDIQEKTKMVHDEVRNLSTVKHKFIVEFYRPEECRNTFLIFMEYMEGGAVDQLLEEKGRIEEPMVQKFTKQLLVAVSFLHNKGIIHKDIKGANILLDKPQQNIKLADFGICTKMNTLKIELCLYFVLCTPSHDLLTYTKHLQKHSFYPKVNNGVVTTHTLWGRHYLGF
ncbi:PREDICTED: serine/threonine-protein kinase PAK 6-like isoform X3 [Acropora digitifera]|uniref:serine/threonine-protein kinase PAK 6-like isoform X3 n=1 Tax=Acropora digitifera TaxID=70779 RepID=UPI00077A0F37|nr:PREDICTED: serine/threonine-protein kinase PAK 6-like isoform X3 [Acropora digitifera]